jgi:hypothetical protein
MGEMRNVHKILVEKRGGNRPVGIPRVGWEDNIKMDLQETALDNVDWILPAQDRVQ